MRKPKKPVRLRPAPKPKPSAMDGIKDALDSIGAFCSDLDPADQQEVNRLFELANVMMQVRRDLYRTAVEAEDRLQGRRAQTATSALDLLQDKPPIAGRYTANTVVATRIVTAKRPGRRTGDSR